MSYHMRPVGLCLGGLLLAMQAGAQTVYVTDMLQLGLYRQAGSGGQTLRSLPSGTALELLERGRSYARVRTLDGTEGWAKIAFLVEEKPARARLADLESQNQALSREVAAMRQALSSARRRVEELEKRAATSAALAGESRSRLEALHEENQDSQKILAADKHAVALPWLLGVTGVSLLLGLVGGSWFLDYRIRQRHGGYRIY